MLIPLIFQAFDLSPCFAHAATEAPRECCGLICRIGDALVYRPCRNIAPQGHLHFILAPEDWAMAESQGFIIEAVVHSHVVSAPTPSEADKVACNKMGIPWLIVSSAGHSFWVLPDSSQPVPPLEGRQYFWGILDCYTLVRDYYEVELGIKLPDDAVYDNPNFGRDGDGVIARNFARFGFERINAQMQKHDVLVMTVNGAAAPNHLAVYLGGEIMLHQLANRLSGRDVFGGYWERCLAMVLRYRDLPCV